MASGLRPPLVCAALAVVTLLSLRGSCDDGEQNKAVATDLFDAGVRKMQEGKCDQSPVDDPAVCSAARDAFGRSYALYPNGLGALRNLAYVEEHLGLIASAARNFRELTRRAPLDPKPARRLWAEFAKKEFEAIAGRIPHLTIEMPAERPASMSISLDGSPLPEAGWGTALDVDPGHHLVRAEAPDHTPFEESIDVKERDEKRITIVLPSTAHEVEAAKGPTKSPPLPPMPIAPPLTASRIAPLVVTGVGVVTIGVGLGLGYAAIRHRQDACGESHFCEPTELDSGRSVAKASTIVTIAGAATLAGGLAWYFLSGPSYAQRTAIVLPYGAPEGAGVGAFGTF